MIVIGETVSTDGGLPAGRAGQIIAFCRMQSKRCRLVRQTGFWGLVLQTSGQSSPGILDSLFQSR
jgi:hypothetical protein